MTNIVSLPEAKAYLRVDYTEEDSTIEDLLIAAQVLCCDVARISSDDWKNIVKLQEGTHIINGTEYTDLNALNGQLKTAVLYTLGYLFEHREEADHHELTLTLRSLLFGIREGVL